MQIHTSNRNKPFVAKLFAFEKGLYDIVMKYAKSHFTPAELSSWDQAEKERKKKGKGKSDILYIERTNEVPFPNLPTGSFHSTHSRRSIQSSTDSHTTLENSNDKSSNRVVGRRKRSQKSLTQLIKSQPQKNHPSPRSTTRITLRSALAHKDDVEKPLEQIPNSSHPTTPGKKTKKRYTR